MVWCHRKKLGRLMKMLISTRLYVEIQLGGGGGGASYVYTQCAEREYVADCQVDNGRTVHQPPL